MARATIGERLGYRFRRHVADPLDHRRRSILNRHRSFDPLFATGAMGSGTTLLGQQLGQRFELAAVIPESSLEISAGSFLHSRAIAEFDSVASYERSIECDSSWSTSAGIADMMALYRSRAGVDPDGSTLIVDKAANTHMLRAEFLLECFPEASMLAVFRDPAANIEGFRRKWPTFGGDALEASIRFYRRIHEALLAAQDRFAARIHIVEYEALVADPDAAFGRLGARLELELAQGPKTLATRPNQPGQGLRNVEGGSIRIVRDANALSHSKLGLDVADRIRSELDDLHVQLQGRAIDLA